MIEILSDIDPLQILSQIAQRQDLTISQRAAYGAEALPLLRAKTKRKRPLSRDGWQKKDTRQIIADALHITRGRVQHADELRRCNTEYFNQVKAGTLELEQARRQAGMLDRSGKRPVIRPTKAERITRVRAFAAEGKSVSDIARIENMRPETIYRYIAEYHIVLSKPIRSRRVFNVNYIVEQAVLDLANMQIYLDAIPDQLEHLDCSRIPDWVERLKHSRNIVSRIIGLLQRKGGLHREKDDK